MQKEEHLIQLGDFVLDLRQLLIYRDAVELAIEPKVMELLIYLYRHRDRYVSLEELHQQVWIDRVVSDTAVRGTIKKLRNLLGDNDLSNPSYIKSVSKRGYKLNCDITSLNEPQSSLPDIATSESLLQVSGGYAADVMLPSSRIKNLTKPIIIMVTTVLLAMCLLAAFNGLKPLFESEVQLSDIQQLTDFHGEKLSLAVSANGRYIAFSGRTSPDQDRQIYLFDKQSKQTRQLTTKATNAAFVRFAQNDKVLIYSNSLTNDSSLHLLPLTIAEPESAMVTLLTGKNIIGQIENGVSVSEIIFVMAETAGSSIMVYSLNINTSVLKRLVTVSQPNEHFHDVALSPNKDFLALLKQQQNGYQILIYDLEKKHEINVQSIANRVSNILWHNDHQLISLDDKAISLLDIKSKNVTSLYSNTDSLISAIASHDGFSLAVAKKSKTRSERLYIEQDLSHHNSNPSIINTTSEVTAMFYGDSNHTKWVTLLKDNVYSIARLNTDNQSITEVYQSQKKLELFDIVEDKQLLLLKEGERLLLVSALNGDVRYLMSSSGMGSDAVFSQDDKQVLFGIRIGEQWEIQQVDIAELTSTTLLKGYQSIRQAKDGYVVADTHGQLFYYPSLEEKRLALNHRIGFEFINRWYVKQNKVIWTTFDYRYTYLHQLELLTNEYKVRKSPFFSLFPRVSINEAADRILYLSVQLNDTSIGAMSIVSTSQ